MLTAIQSFGGSRFGKYLLIGGVASAIDVGLFLVLHELMGVTALVSHSISIPISAIYSFTCNALFNFKKTDKIPLRFLSFMIVVALGYALGAAIIWFVESYLAMSGTVGKFLSLPFVVVLQFWLNSLVSFKD